MIWKIQQWCFNNPSVVSFPSHLDSWMLVSKLPFDSFSHTPCLKCSHVLLPIGTFWTTPAHNKTMLECWHQESAPVVLNSLPQWPRPVLLPIFLCGEWYHLVMQVMEMCTEMSLISFYSSLLISNPSLTQSLFPPNQLLNQVTFLYMTQS